MMMHGTILLAHVGTGLPPLRGEGRLGLRHSVRQVPDRDDLPPRRTKTLMALPDTHPYFVVLSHSCVALSRLVVTLGQASFFN